MIRVIYDENTKKVTGFDYDSPEKKEEEPYVLVENERHMPLVEMANSGRELYVKDIDKAEFALRDIILSDEDILREMRFKRESLLLAFDKWEKAVLRGREEDSEEVMQWYQNLLDLQSFAFYNIPDRVKYFMR